MPKFKTFETRMKHTQGKLIPLLMWQDNELFCENLDDTVLSLMKTNDGNLFTLLEQSVPKLHDQWLKKQAFLAITLSHPALDLPMLQSIAETLQFDDYTLFSLLIILGNSNLLEAWINQQSDSIEPLITKNVFYVYMKAAEYGHDEILKKLEEKAPKQITEMVRVANFSPYSNAAKNGHIGVLSHLEAKEPHLIPAMIKASFKDAVFHGRLDVLKHMEEKLPELVLQLIKANHCFAYHQSLEKGYTDQTLWLRSKQSQTYSEAPLQDVSEVTSRTSASVSDTASQRFFPAPGETSRKAPFAKSRELNEHRNQ